MLDHTCILYGSGISEGNLHDYHNLPLLLAGPKQPGGGRHVQYPKDSPAANLHITLLAKLGVRLEALGDSNGGLDFLADI